MPEPKSHRRESSTHRLIYAQAKEDAVELKEAVTAAIKSQNEKHAQVIEAELKRQESATRCLPRHTPRRRAHLSILTQATSSCGTEMK